MKLLIQQIKHMGHRKMNDNKKKYRFLENHNPVVIILYILFAIWMIYLFTHLPENYDYSDNTVSYDMTDTDY